MRIENRRSQRGYGVIEMLIVIALVSIILIVFLPPIVRAKQQSVLKALTGIEAPLPNRITDAQRDLIRKPLANKVIELELAYMRCDADRMAYIEGASRRYKEAQLASTASAQEANDALKRLSETEAQLQKALGPPYCSRYDLDMLIRVRKAYGLEPSKTPTP